MRRHLITAFPLPRKEVRCRYCRADKCKKTPVGGLTVDPTRSRLRAKAWRETRELYAFQQVARHVDESLKRLRRSSRLNWNWLIKSRFGFPETSLNIKDLPHGKGSRGRGSRTSRSINRQWDRPAGANVTSGLFEWLRSLSSKTIPIDAAERRGKRFKATRETIKKVERGPTPPPPTPQAAERAHLHSLTVPHAKTPLIGDANFDNFKEKTALKYKSIYCERCFVRASIRGTPCPDWHFETWGHPKAPG